MPEQSNRESVRTADTLRLGAVVGKPRVTNGPDKRSTRAHVARSSPLPFPRPVRLGAPYPCVRRCWVSSTASKVRWNNAWRNAKNHDAVWLFVKVRSGPNAGWRHARLLATSRSASTPMTCEASADKVGIFCQPTATHRGDLTGDVVLDIDPSSLPESMRNGG